MKAKQTPTIQNAIREYLQRMAEIKNAGGATNETSFYTALENLLNNIGQRLTPKVICNSQLRSQGAGHPDFGLYTKRQCLNNTPKKELRTLPERGVIEVKPLSAETTHTAQTSQTKKYLTHYRLLLITNYREFRLLSPDKNNNPIELETFTLAQTEPTFWKLAAQPEKTAHAHGHQLGEFLQRALISAATLTRSQDIAWLLASHARDTLTTLEEKNPDTLKPLRDALETALGIQFENDKGEHFFRATLVQTLFYGIFSAWIIHAQKTNEHFDWRLADHLITVPMIRSLFEEIAKPTRLQSLQLTPFIDLAANALNRIDRNTFLKTFDTGQAIQHFYEPFLEAFDPKLRKQLGVWYTPPEIVQYIVARVHTTLQKELHIPLGLADQKVYILDPCCGTGTFLLETLKTIKQTLENQNPDALLKDDIKDAALNRIFGFEIMPAPFVIAHWQITNYLNQIDAPLNHDSNKNQRPAIYLTNALTGWQPLTNPKTTIPLFPEFENERDQSQHIKQKKPILVILGNPPYNAYAGTSPQEEHNLVQPYKKDLIQKWNIKKFNLDDLYIRFFRIAERRITQTGRGIIAYISNYSYTTEPSFVTMRQSILHNFDKIWIDNMHGNRKISERAPDGQTSQTIFAIPGFSPGIKQGIVITLAAKTHKPNPKKTILYRDNLNAAKATDRRQQLLNSLSITHFDQQYTTANPQPWNRYSLRPIKTSHHYLTWPKLTDLAKKVFNGPVERRGRSLIAFEKSTLQQRMSAYFNPEVTNETIANLHPSLMMTGNEIVGPEARQKILSESQFNHNKIVTYPYKPFDIRFCYLDNIRPLFSRPSPELLTHQIPKNWFFITRAATIKKPEGAPCFASPLITDYSFHSGCARHFPIFTIETTKRAPKKNHHKTNQPQTEQQTNLPVNTTNNPTKTQPTANLSQTTRDYLTQLGLPNPDHNPTTAQTIWLHALAITYAPAYLKENADPIAIDWPRIPLPKKRDTLENSAKLGAQIATLLDTETPINGITSDNISPFYKTIAPLTTIHPNTKPDLHLTAGWGSKDNQGHINPGRGKTKQHTWTPTEKTTLHSNLTALGIIEKRGKELLGQPINIQLNHTTHWQAVPKNVWNYHIGGYQIIKKWLAYREQKIINRPLTKHEARHITNTIRRLTALILLTDQLNTNYTATRNQPYPWPPSP